MQAKLNSKEFLKVETLKCAAKSYLMAWYHDICVHKNMWGIFTPPILLPTIGLSDGIAIGQTIPWCNCAIHSGRNGKTHCQAIVEHNHVPQGPIRKCYEGYCI
jgi:hypothetical protein